MKAPAEKPKKQKSKFNLPLMLRGYVNPLFGSQQFLRKQQLTLERSGYPKNKTSEI